MAYIPNFESMDYKTGYEEGFQDGLTPPPNYEAERKVIAAAKAVLAAAVVEPNKMVCPPAFFEPLRTLHKALKALEEK
jgi:hypothetical protein